MAKQRRTEGWKVEGWKAEGLGSKKQGTKSKEQEIKSKDFKGKSEIGSQKSDTVRSKTRISSSCACLHVRHFLSFTDDPITTRNQRSKSFNLNNPNSDSF